MILFLQIYKKNPEIKKIYKIYQQELIRLNCVDFGDLILHCIKIFNIIKIFVLNTKNYLNIF